MAFASANAPYTYIMADTVLFLFCPPNEADWNSTSFKKRLWTYCIAIQTYTIRKEFILFSFHICWRPIVAHLSAWSYYIATIDSARYWKEYETDIFSLFPVGRCLIFIRYGSFKNALSCLGLCWTRQAAHLQAVPQEQENRLSHRRSRNRNKWQTPALQGLSYKLSLAMV